MVEQVCSLKISWITTYAYLSPVHSPIPIPMSAISNHSQVFSHLQDTSCMAPQVNEPWPNFIAALMQQQPEVSEPVFWHHFCLLRLSPDQYVSPSSSLSLLVCFWCSPLDFPHCICSGPDWTSIGLRTFMLPSSSRHMFTLNMIHLSVAPPSYWWARIADLPPMPSRRA